MIASISRMQLFLHSHSLVASAPTRVLTMVIPAEGRLSERFTRLKSNHVSNNKNKNKNKNAENHSGFGQNGTGSSRRIGFSRSRIVRYDACRHSKTCDTKILP